ncbi:Aspartate aminotransferase [Caprobacter fermentans]|uniref:Aminotransferase n=1 Tax=Caproicibacter fermentans TaxID=2576756 RepID=A0A6N8HWW1_9FIRM|nr:pyridoxal phosphate-dependent aminotransferase [Caproicibacter fermentans]MVB10020.1 Aspartate aminotransferase [Caproicibacter fermentans]OCN02586.1 hypothetical protein A7X67_05540 [Clostridium sp. W14A]QNK42029.1 pyridoxal phosphate-dependent aminotransferase [Caproicibacter fermentans]
MKSLSVNALAAPTSGIRKIFNLAVKMDDCVKLMVGEPDFPTPEHIVEAACRALHEGKTGYTVSAGIPQLRALIAESVGKRKGIHADPEQQVIVTNGATGALYLSMKALLNPGDEIIIGVPLFSNYLGQAISIGAVPKFVTLREENGFIMDCEDLEKAVTPKTKAILLNSPSNPIGSIISPETLGKIAEIAVKHDLYVISDEVYQDYNYGGVPVVSIASFPGMQERTVIIDSFSKTYAMTGWRVGYAVSSPEMIRLMISMQDDVISCVNTMAQYAAVEALSGPQDSVGQMIDEFRVRRDLLVEGIEKIEGLKCVKPNGAFYLYVNISGTGLTSEDFAMRLLREARVAVVPGTAFGPGGTEYVRISYVTSQKNLLEGVKRISDFVKNL